jgi:hypothetical protein
VESYEDAIKIIMREHKVDEPTAALMVADIYPALTAADEEASRRARVDFDPIDSEALGLLYTPPAPKGRPVPIDDDRSPAGAILAQAERMEAKRTGDHYRNLSKRTSMHLAR